MSIHTRLHAAWVWVIIIAGALLSVTMFTYAGATDRYIAQLESTESRVAGERIDPNTVRLIVSDGGELHREKHSLNESSSLTALALLQSFAEAGSWQLEIQNTQYGALINAIDGRVNGSDNKYWIYYVNGEMALVGAGDYVVQPGDRIEFRFEESIF